MERSSAIDPDVLLLPHRAFTAWFEEWVEYPDAMRPEDVRAVRRLIEDRLDDMRSSLDFGAAFVAIVFASIALALQLFGAESSIALVIAIAVLVVSIGSSIGLIGGVIRWEIRYTRHLARLIRAQLIVERRLADEAARRRGPWWRRFASWARASVGL